MINNILNEKNLDAIIITSRENRQYLSGFTGSDGLLVLTSDKKYLLVDGRYTIQAKQQTKGFEVVEFKASPYKYIEEFGFKKIGFEDGNILYSQYQKLPNCDKIGVSADINNLRMVKNKIEFDKMQKAASIADKAFSHILNFIKCGVTERELANEIDHFMKCSGAEKTSFDTIVASGERTALPHAGPSDNAVKNGDFVLMDFGCVYEGYCSDMTRTVAVGEVSDEKRKIYETVLDAQQNALNKIKAGELCRDIDKIARDIITEKGFGSNFGHGLGHGVGLEIHEEPRLSPKSEQRLSDGMVVTVEPGIYVEGLCGVRIEDMVYVNGDGYINFTASSKELIVLKN